MGSEVSKTISTTEARQSVQEIVDQSTISLDGEWQVYSGPSVEQCTKGNGGDGAAYSYIKSLDGPSGDPAQDIATVKRLWEGAGITTAPYKSGGSDPILGLRGVGGPTTSISFLAGAQRYTITAVSECADGDAVEMQGNGE
ncbi:hypothetical protein DEJ25_01975 [Curtobacterium sp. MCPF17_011]|nr:hypothetical protein DEJ31_08495 [Curtobacterium sp. MCPF17_031]PZF15518.1 hypothetical protein DEJ25_01975 [Curtobacterium sp. MCPF17_011]